jgi:hypothetical protein
MYHLRDFLRKVPVSGLSAKRGLAPNLDRVILGLSKEVLLINRVF